MYNKNIPDDRELPSNAQLIKSTIIAAVVAVLILVTIIMPAEYGIDPTGAGKLTGLQKMGEIKISLAKEAEDERKAKEAAVTNPPAILAAPAIQVQTIEQPAAPVSKQIRSDEMKVTLTPNEGTEIKVDLEKGKSVQYTWSTDGGKANFDVHADSKELSIDYHGYEKGSDTKRTGMIEAAFTGSHGWFWRNRTAETITITLKTSGEYTSIKHMK